MSRVPSTYIPRVDIATHFAISTRTTVLLHPRRAAVPDPFASKVGGRFAWPENEEWPKCPQDGEVFVPILQLKKKDVPELIFPGEMDLFQLLWCGEDHEGESADPLTHVFWRKADAIGPLLDEMPATSPDIYNTSHIPRECAVFPERVVECDPAQPNTDSELIDEWLRIHATEDFEAIGLIESYREDAYLSQFAAAPSTKIGGFPSYIQDMEEQDIPVCECSSKMRYFLTVSSRDIGDGCSHYRWAPSDIERDENHCPKHAAFYGTDLCLGDAGSVYVYICQSCPSMPTAAILQCS
ncbi:hypothetical protein BWQ96_07054 [Gracilariopsis chorda]|uniref:DUF1963 domain-containing protein n=1 Tax=Gracilariopsis chorda TaxID=448386 RepID=A0A2V3IMB3_9FLOR|nr:hypothetical protein BWQ96_07054 [Gracilariopsis chorda]|eukprot:PXF43225.1 hypothetical protein BWQ96_07054 [Gracilariopsis chorda]